MAVTLRLANTLVQNQVLGKGLAFPMREDPTNGDFLGVAGADNVKQCIIDLITTRVGERLMNEDLGTEIADSVFESQQAVIDILPLRVREAINQFEPRVQSVTASAVPFSLDNGLRGVKLNVSWVLRSGGGRDSLVYPYYLEPAEGGLS